MRDYPAYARTLAKHVAMAQRPVVAVVLLSSRWGYFDHLPKVCLRPAEWRRDKFEFGYLRGLHVAAVPGDDCTEPMLGELLVELMAAGPRELWVWNADGTKLYDENWPLGIANWVIELTRGAVHYKTAKAAAAMMATAQLKSVQNWQVAYERISARSVEEGVRFYLDSEAVKDRVRELLSSPHRASESRAA